MRDRFFIDTNLLVYANDASSRDKRRTARKIVSLAFDTKLGCLSTQVLQEFFVVVTRKAGVSSENARAQVLKLWELDVVLLDRDIVVGAMDLHLVHRLSYWDALVIKSASASGCKRIYTEDMQHGQTIDGVMVHNPFVEPI